MNLHSLLALALDPARILTAQGLAVDPWQRELLSRRDPLVLLNCSRQAGKSTAAAALALHEAIFHPGALVLLLSPGLRQSGELFRKVLDGYHALGRPLRATAATQFRLELVNGSRLLALPGREATLRCFAPTLLIVDEAARVPDDLYRAIRPMLAVTHGRLVALSTPFGQRGWFYDEWHGNGPWTRIMIPWQRCQRIQPAFIREEERALGKAWVQQEYECLFTALEGLVYPDFNQALMETNDREGRSVGGIDWGWRNPFAAVWGVIDDEDILWINGERYLRETPLHEHARALPRLSWYADPAGRTEIEEFRSAGHSVRPALNDIRLGIAAVTARLRTGRLKIDPRRCPNLVGEARLYRYPRGTEKALFGENPVDAHNHALGALRYLVSRLDTRFIARLRNGKLPKNEQPTRGNRLRDDSHWTFLD